VYLIGSECGGRNVEAFEIQCDKDDSTGDERPRSLLPKGLECIRDGTRKLEVDSTKGLVGPFDGVESTERHTEFW